jgi:hypothetical protein
VDGLRARTAAAAVGCEIVGGVLNSLLGRLPRVLISGEGMLYKTGTFRDKSKKRDRTWSALTLTFSFSFLTTAGLAFVYNRKASMHHVACHAVEQTRTARLSLYNICSNWPHMSRVNALWCVFIKKASSLARNSAAFCGYRIISAAPVCAEYEGKQTSAIRQMSWRSTFFQYCWAGDQ